MRTLFILVCLLALLAIIKCGEDGEKHEKKKKSESNGDDNGGDNDGHNGDDNVGENSGDNGDDNGDDHGGGDRGGSQLRTGMSPYGVPWAAITGPILPGPSYPGTCGWSKEGGNFGGYNPPKPSKWGRLRKLFGGGGGKCRHCR